MRRPRTAGPGLVRLESRQGKESDCRAHASEALSICVDRDIHLGEAWVLFALGDLELALGRPPAAVEQFERLRELLHGLGISDPDLSPAPDHELDRRFEAALDIHRHTLDRFEVGRTRLAYGSRLRRARRRVDARPQLREALAIFDDLGASRWSDQAATGLEATGETVPRREMTGIAALTPQELQVSLLLAEGRTTRKAAAALFLSPKTVEYHLRHTYTKLDIHSRAELADALDDTAGRSARPR